MDPDNHSHADAPLVPVDEETQDAEEVARRAYLKAIATARTGFDLLLSQIDPGASDPMVLDAKNTLTDWRGQLAQEGPSGDDRAIQSGIDLKVDGSLRTTIIDHLEMAEHQGWESTFGDQDGCESTLDGTQARDYCLLRLDVEADE